MRNMAHRVEVFAGGRGLDICFKSEIHDNVAAHGGTYFLPHAILFVPIVDVYPRDRNDPHDDVVRVLLDDLEPSNGAVVVHDTQQVNKELRRHDPARGCWKTFSGSA